MNGRINVRLNARRMTDRMSEYMPERMSDRMLENICNICIYIYMLPDDMSETMSEQCVRVRITRSKVICELRLITGFDSLPACCLRRPFKHVHGRDSSRSDSCWCYSSWAPSIITRVPIVPTVIVERSNAPPKERTQPAEIKHLGLSSFGTSQ